MFSHARINHTTKSVIFYALFQSDYYWLDLIERHNLIIAATFTAETWMQKKRPSFRQLCHWRDTHKTDQPLKPRRCTLFAQTDMITSTKVSTATCTLMQGQADSMTQARLPGFGIRSLWKLKDFQIAPDSVVEARNCLPVVFSISIHPRYWLDTTTTQRENLTPAGTV